MFNKDSLKITIVALELLIDKNIRGLYTLHESELSAATQALAGMQDMLDGNVVASVWTIADVKSLVDEDDEREPVTDDEAREVLELADEQHDANYGINWDVLNSHLDFVRSN